MQGVGKQILIIKHIGGIIMQIQITNTATGGKSEVIDFSKLTLQDLKVMIEYCGEISITKV